MSKNKEVPWYLSENVRTVDEVEEQNNAVEYLARHREAEEALRSLREYSDEERSVLGLGCGDNSCYFVRPKGMATNGGCGCLPGRGMLPTLKNIIPAYLELLKAKK
jgi:hypothetical protein